MKIHFTASHSRIAQHALVDLTRRYGQADAGQADVMVTLGGDGRVLQTIYESLPANKPIFALRRTESVGFLCNDYREEGLIERIQVAQKIILHPLKVETRTTDGAEHETLAINEVSILRETPQAARLSISIDGVVRLSNYSGDGVLVATPAGSTAYNHSCGGPIMPLDANTLVMTAISGYRPRGWSYAVLPQTSLIEIEVLETGKRPVRIEAGAGVIRHVASAKIRHDPTTQATLLFDPDLHLAERIIREQFLL